MRVGSKLSFYHTCWEWRTHGYEMGDGEELNTQNSPWLRHYSLGLRIILR